MLQMLRMAESVSTPDDLLNAVGEFQRLQEYLIRCVDQTPVLSAEYDIDGLVLRRLIRHYAQGSTGWVLLKMPVYPVIMVDAFMEAIPWPVKLIVVERRFEAIIASYKRRLEDLYYLNSPRERRRWSMLLPPRQRDVALKGALGFGAVLAGINEHIHSRLDACSTQWSSVQIEDWASSSDVRSEVLSKLDIPVAWERIEAMSRVVDLDRLAGGRPASSRALTSIKRLCYRAKCFVGSAFRGL